MRGFLLFFNQPVILPLFPLSLFGLGIQIGSEVLHEEAQKKEPQEQFNYLCSVLTHAMSKLTYIPKLGLFFVIPLIALLLSSCDRDNGDVVPYVFLNLNLGLSTDLASLGVGEEATITADYNGAWWIQFNNPRLPDVPLGLGQIVNGNGPIIYRKDIYTYEVYDITCTFQAQ